MTGDNYRDEHASQESSSDELTNGLLDLEASEADSEPALVEQDGFDHDSGDLLQFTNFTHFPAEIREMIWKEFCPELTGPRVFDVIIVDLADPRAIPGPHLESQTASMRALLAVHRESRSMGLKASPHVFSLSAGECIRYHENRDIIHLTREPTCRGDAIIGGLRQIRGSPRNIAFGPIFSRNFVRTCSTLSAVERVFILPDDDESKSTLFHEYLWQTSEKLNFYYTETEEEGEAGLSTKSRRLYCWPEHDGPNDFVEESTQKTTEETTQETTEETTDIPRGWDHETHSVALLHSCGFLAPAVSSAAKKSKTTSSVNPIEVWPMLQFNGDASLQTFDDMKARRRLGKERYTSSTDSEDSEDEYESEGIDDGPISDHLSTDDEDDLPGQLLDGSSESNNHLAAQFSNDSDEGGADTESQGGHAEASGSEEGLRIRASRPQRRVVESDSEDTSAKEACEPRGAASRRARVVVVDSEDDGDDNHDDDDNDEDDDGCVLEGGSSRPQGAVHSSDDENSEPAPSKSMSLFKRLKMAVHSARSGHAGEEASITDGNDYGPASDDEEDEDSGSGSDGVVITLANSYDDEWAESE